MSSVITTHKKLIAVGLAVLFALLTAFTVMGSQRPAQAAAAEMPHYATWEEAKKEYFPDSETTNMNEVAYAIGQVLEAGKQNKKAGNTDAAYKCAQDAYYGYYEVCGFERQTMSRISGARKNEVEFMYRDLRKAAKKGSYDDFVAASETLYNALKEDGLKLSPMTEALSKLTGESAEGGTSVNAGVFFLEAFIILLREGLEAILVIGGIIAYLVKSGNRKLVWAVYVGSGIAVILSFVAAVVLGIIKSANAAGGGAQQELIEGITALIAVAVLFYVCNWMLHKSEAEAWDRYIDKKVESSVSKGSMIALGFTAFLAVFREGAEVVLFYQPMLSDAGSVGGGIAMVWLGVGVAVVALAAIFILIRVFSIRLPLRPFFLATSILMALMAVIFLGSGIKELLEGGFDYQLYIQGVSDVINGIPVNDALDLFGIYPHTETIVPQIILMLIFVALFIVQFVSGKRRKAQKTAQMAAEGGGVAVAVQTEEAELPGGDVPDPAEPAGIPDNGQEPGSTDRESQDRKT